MRYINKKNIEIGDIITDGSPGNEEFRLKNRAKVLYVDKFHMIWFPLNLFTTHGRGFKSESWCLTNDPLKIDINDLSKEEMELYLDSSTYLTD